jgi:DNA-binding protein HU-beta
MKKQLINKAAKLSGMTKKDTAKAMDALLAAIEDSLLNGEEVQLCGFGSFSVKEFAAHMGRNPKTNQEIEVPASKCLVFSASKVLKDKLNA